MIWAIMSCIKNTPLSHGHTCFLFSPKRQKILLFLFNSLNHVEVISIGVGVIICFHVDHQWYQ